MITKKEKMSIFIEIFINPFPGAIFLICYVTQGYSIEVIFSLSLIQTYQEQLQLGLDTF